MKNKYSIDDFLHGSGGKGSSAKTPKEAPNTLQSRSTIVVQEVISEGEIVGVVGGLKGVYFDTTPVQNIDGTFNYPGTVFDERVGTATQPYMAGFPGTESAIVVNTEVNLSPVVRTVSSNTVDAVRVTVRLPAGLNRRDMKTGDLNGYRLGIAIDVRPTGGGVWTTAASKTITGKATTPYEASYRVEKPTGISTTWDVRVRRTTVKGTTQDIVDTLDWFVFTEIQDIKVSYPDAALVGLAIDSEATGGAVPRRSYLVDGLIIKVPTNYFPTVYAEDGSVSSYAYYTGVWDGTFKDSWCDDPAWILYDLLSHTRYGMGEYIDINTIDIYSFYEASKYNVQLISNGTAGAALEPRFTANFPLATREDAFRVIQSIAAMFRAVVFSGPGYIRLIQDRPTSPTATINNANIIGGLFNYMGSELATRFTSVDVTYNDITNGYNLRTINEEATNAEINAYGYNKTELTAIGVVRESQARRLAKWAIDSAMSNKEGVTFSTSFTNFFVEIGDVVNISDNWYAGEMFSGVLRQRPSGTVNQIRFDRPLTIPSGTTIKFLTFDGVEYTRVTAAAGTNTTDYNLVNIPGNLINPNSFPNVPFTVFNAVSPRQFKINNITESDVGIYEVSAVIYDPTKFARVEAGVYIEPPVFTNIGNWTIGQPTNLAVSTESYINPQGVLRYRLRFNWDDIDDPMLRGYAVQYRRNNEAYTWANGILNSEYTLDDCVPGIYEYNVFAYNTRAVQSPPASGYFELNVGDGTTSLIAAPTALQLIEGGSVFTGTNFQIKWTAPPEITTATLMDYEVKLYDGINTSGPLIQTLFTPTIGQIFDRADIIAWAGSAIRNIHITVRARDTLERFSLATGVTFSNPAPAVLTSVALTAFFSQYQVDHAAPVGTDIAGILINHSTASGFTPSSSNLVLDDVGTSHLIPAAALTTYYVRLAAYDTWSNTNLNYTSEFSVTTQAVDVGITPSAPSEFAASSSIIETSPGVQQAKVVLTWTRSSNVSSYDLEILSTAIGYAEFPQVSQPDTGTVSYSFITNAGIPFTFRIRSRASNSVSVWSAVVSHTTASDTTAPAVPTSITITSGFNGASLRWTNPADTDLAFVEVYRRQLTPSVVAEALIATVATSAAAPISAYFDTNLITGATYQYRIRAVDTSGNLGTFTALTNSGAIIGVAVNSVDTAAIQNAAITGLKIAANTITAAKILAGTITAIEIAANTITSANILAGTIVASDIAAGTITANEIAANTITAAKIAANTITAGQINAASISAAILVADSITTAMLQAGSVTASEVAANTIITNNANIQSGIIVNAHIANATIEGAKIANAAITNAKISGIISSNNYVAGSTGWAINKSTGNAEFSSVNARGIFKTGTTGTRVEVGADSGYLMWAGDGTKNDANAIFFIKSSGDAYFGGSLSAGTINNSARTTVVSGTATIGTGNGTYLGGTRTVIASLSYTKGGLTTSAPWSGTTGVPQTTSVVVSIQRSVSGGAFTTVASTTMTGEREWNFEGGEYTYTCGVGGSLTFNDTSGGTGPINYRTILSSASKWPVTVSGNNGSQSTGISAKE